MATNQALDTFTVPASADLSAYQHHIVTLDTDGKAALATDADSATAPPMTVLMNKPASDGAAAELACPGSVVKVVCGDAFDETAAITCDGNGEAIATTTAGDKTIGKALTAGVAGSLATVLLSMDMIEATGGA